MSKECQLLTQIFIQERLGIPELDLKSLYYTLFVVVTFRYCVFQVTRQSHLWKLVSEQSRGNLKSPTLGLVVS